MSIRFSGPFRATTNFKVVILQEVTPPPLVIVSAEAWFDKWGINDVWALANNNLLLTMATSAFYADDIMVNSNKWFDDWDSQSQIRTIQVSAIASADGIPLIEDNDWYEVWGSAGNWVLENNNVLVDMGTNILIEPASGISSDVNPLWQSASAISRFTITTPLSAQVVDELDGALIVSVNPLWQSASAISRFTITTPLSAQVIVFASATANNWFDVWNSASTVGIFVDMAPTAMTEKIDQPIIGASGAVTSYNINDINTGSAYQVFEFTGNGVLEMAGNGLVDYLIVGAGGGGRITANGGGGGGAGGLLSASNYLLLSNGKLNITVGAGSSGFNGGNSSIGDSVIATGGGYGGQGSTAPARGGSGGGGGGSTFSFVREGAAGIIGQGFAGGSSIHVTTGPAAGGGGGGSGGIGLNGAFSSGAGGAGSISTITGTSKFYAAGGSGGSAFSGGVQTSAASGIGGIGAVTTAGPVAPVQNTGSGGGGYAGSLGNSSLCTGANGIVIIRQKIPS